jgi:hypothetical protein
MRTDDEREWDLSCPTCREASCDCPLDPVTQELADQPQPEGRELRADEMTRAVFTALEKAGKGGAMTTLAAALVKAQAQIKGATKDSTNPHFKNTYADLGSVWDACREALQLNGFSVIQHGDLYEGQWVLTTLLLHESGESMTGRVPLLNSKGDMQGLGSAITYARRYGLAAMVGVCPEDDDANAASARPARVEPARVEARAPEGYDNWRLDFEATAESGTKALGEAFKASPEAFRRHYTETVGEPARAALRAIAKAADAKAAA